MINIHIIHHLSYIHIQVLNVILIYHFFLYKFINVDNLIIILNLDVIIFYV